MATKTSDQNDDYEDIIIDNKESIIDNNSNDSKLNELELIAKQLSKDYSLYFKIDTNSEKKETDDSIEDLLTHLEEFCGLLEMIRTDNNICLEQVVQKVRPKSSAMTQMYDKIDKLEEFVAIVKKCVEEMEEEMAKAERLFANNNKVKKFFTSFIGNSKQSDSQRKAKYEPKDIFKTSDYILNIDLDVIQKSSQLPKDD